MSHGVSGIELLAAAIGWYQSNGAAPLPKKGIISGTRVNAALLHRDDEDDVYDLEDLSSDDDHAIGNVPGKVIPVLAAISLGFDSVALAKVINEHSVTLQNIRWLEFENAGNTIIQLYENGHSTASPTKINIEIFKAFAADPVLCDELHRTVSSEPDSMTCIGLMHTIESDLWPAAKIEEHARLVMTPTKRVITSVYVAFEFISSRPEHADELPNQSPIDLIKRSGMLTDAVLRKQTGCFSLWEDLLYVATSDQPQPLQIEILKAFTQVKDKQTVDLLVRGLLSVTSETFESPLFAEDVHSLLKSIFSDQPAFAPVLDSVALKLNLLPVDWVPNEADINNDPHFYNDLVNNQQTLISRIANELLARPAEHLGTFDYSVFKKLTGMNLPPQVIDFSPEHLVNHILDSIRTYKTPNQVTCQSKVQVDEWAMENLESMVKLLMRDHTFDVNKFTHLEDDSKISLIKAGVGISLKSLSRKGRGQVLEDSMGL
jgi:hypothetical protein